MRSHNPGVSDAVALQAAEWFLLLGSGQASPSDHERLRQWRAANAAHEIAWQRAERLQQRLTHLPPALALPVLSHADRPARRRAVKALAWLVIAPHAAWLAWRSDPVRQRLADYRTATGEQRRVTLPDGTQLWMNTASAVDVAYDDALRLIRLRGGEILVETAQDAASRPFIVQAAHGRLLPLGTRFLVRDTDSEHTHLAVQAGAVDARPMHAPESGIVLHAGQQVTLSAHAMGTPTPLLPEDGSWTNGVLHVRDMRLDDFLAELERYRPGVVSCDAAVADQRISGVFPLRDTDAVLDSLPRALPVGVIRRTRYWVRVTSPTR